MIKIIYFNIAALVILATILISAVYRKMIRGRANISFLVTVAEILIATLFGTFAIYFDNLGAGNVVAKWIFHAGYLLFHTFTAAFYLNYIIAWTDTGHILKHNRLLAAGIWIPMVTFATFLIANCFYPIIFYIDPVTDVYTRGICFSITYIIGAYYLIWGIVYILLNRKLFNLKWILTLFMPYPIILITIIIEFYYPKTTIELFFNTVALLYISYTIQRPEETLDTVTGFGNAITYETVARKAFSNKKPLYDILLKITNFRALDDILGYDERILFEKAVGTEIKIINKETKLRGEICYMKNGIFHILIEDSSFEYAEDAAAKLYRTFNSDFHIGQAYITPSTSICLIKFHDDVESFDILSAFNRSFEDRAHTDRILFASDLMNENYYRILLNIDRIIDRAFTNNSFEVYYQPIYSVEKQCFASAEALLRLKDEEYGFISPDVFIPAAEKSGAIHKIGKFVFYEVCKFISSDDFKNIGIDFIEINLSIPECMQTDIVKQIIDILHKCCVPPSKINIEITETAVAQSAQRLISNLTKLSDAGISISLDDFGSGYSSISRISMLPVSIVKLDKDFIDGIENAKSKVIIEKTVEMLNAINVGVVVEGIETKEMAQQFIDMKCDAIQGFYYAKPMPKNKFIDFINENNMKILRRS